MKSSYSKKCLCSVEHGVDPILSISQVTSQLCAIISNFAKNLVTIWFFNSTVEFADPENPALNRASKTCNNCQKLTGIRISVILQ